MDDEFFLCNDILWWFCTQCLTSGPIYTGYGVVLWYPWCYFCVQLFTWDSSILRRVCVLSYCISFFDLSFTLSLYNCIWWWCCPHQDFCESFIICDNRITSTNNWKGGWYTAFLMAQNAHDNNIILPKMFNCLLFETTSSMKPAVLSIFVGVYIISRKSIYGSMLFGGSK